MSIISIHVDGYYGLVKGVPRMLKILDKYNMKASFFVTLGRESNIFEIISHRRENKIKRINNVPRRYSTVQKAAIVLLNRKIGMGHKEILHEIEKRGHEVNPHCWQHLQWSSNFNNLDKTKEFSKICSSFNKIMGHNPTGFVPPVWKYDNDVLNALKNNKFEYICIRDERKKPFFSNGLVFLPLSLDYAPEEMLLNGLNEEQLLNLYKEEIKKGYSHVYFHADFEGTVGIELFEKILNILSNQKTKMCGEFCRENKLKLRST
jgi:undecaprenyl phosphate-alpha-L-ara4FN deformylase